MNPHLFLCHCPFKGLCKHFMNWLLTPRGVAYDGEIDSPGYNTVHYNNTLQYYTPGRLTCRGIIPLGY